MDYFRLVISIHEYVLYFYSLPRDSWCSKFEEAIVIAATIIPSLPDRVF